MGPLVERLREMNKQAWLDAAEVFDAWRVVPRLILFGYCAWLVYIVDTILAWYMGLQEHARGIEASGMATFVITAVTGIGATVYKIYAGGGRAWDQVPMLTSSTVSQTTVTK